MTIISRLFSFKGRISRKAYFTSFASGVLTSVILFMLVGFFANIFYDNPSEDFYAVLGAVFLIINMPLFIFALSKQVKRLHDLGRPGWHAVMDFIPIANIFFNFQLLLQKGTTGPNKYGPDPLGVLIPQPKTRPGSPDALAVSAASAEKNGDLAQARADYEMFLALTPDNHPARDIIKERLAKLDK